MSGERSPTERVDVCVIGAGPAGATIAESLGRRGHTVVVLEAGPRFDPADRVRRMERALRPAADIPDVWEMGGERDAYRSDGAWYYPLNNTRVKGVGGSTLHWQGMVMRLHESDFNVRSRRGVATDWPIDYADLRPYYARAEAALDVAGAADNPFAPPRQEPFPHPPFAPSYSDQLFAEACSSLGISLHSVPNARNSEPTDEAGPCVGYGTCSPVCPSGAKYDATRHVRAAEAAGVRVLDRVPVQRLETDRDGRTVEAAVYATPDGTTHRQGARHFVVACGGVETPRLLLLSASAAHPDGLANSSGLVGRYFMEHLFAGVGGRLNRPTRQHHVGFITSESHQFYDEPAAGTERGVPEAAVTALDAFKLEFLNYAGPTPLDGALAAGTWGDELLEQLRTAYGHHVAVGALVEQLPRYENAITLDPSRTDDHGNPVPRITWGVDERTKRTIARANELQATILEALGAEVTWQVGPENTGPAFHHMGTTRMGDDPETSVVSPRLRTHDVRNCWIAGSSVFVTGGAMNPTLTLVALALKAADHLDDVL